MLVYGKLKTVTDDSGYALLSVKVPGDFRGIDKTNNDYSGRFIAYGHLWFGSGLDGDHVISFSVRDLDAVLPDDLKAMIPTYPIIGGWNDYYLGAENQGLYLRPGEKTIIDPPSGENAVASGLYICVEVQKASAVVDTIYGNFSWDMR